ncbi:hypothetical protein ACFL6Y_05665 [Elusimicrobiota bacterium]
MTPISRTFTVKLTIAEDRPAQKGFNPSKGHSNASGTNGHNSYHAYDQYSGAPYRYATEVPIAVEKVPELVGNALSAMIPRNGTSSLLAHMDKSRAETVNSNKTDYYEVERSYTRDYKRRVLDLTANKGCFFVGLASISCAQQKPLIGIIIKNIELSTFVLSSISVSTSCRDYFHMEVFGKRNFRPGDDRWIYCQLEEYLDDFKLELIFNEIGGKKRNLWFPFLIKPSHKQCLKT